MSLRNTILLSTIAATMALSSTLPANAFISWLMLADRTIKSETKKAIATPGHVEWCAKQAPGYRKEWNNWRLPNGRVKYCSSPYYTLLWMRGRK